jgi:hypothetical protein
MVFAASGTTTVPMSGKRDQRRVACDGLSTRRGDGPRLPGNGADHAAVRARLIRT